MEPTLNGPFRGGGRFRELEYHYNGIVWVIVWDPNKAIGIGEFSICGGGQLERCESFAIQLLLVCCRFTVSARVGVSSVG